MLWSKKDSEGGYISLPKMLEPSQFSQSIPISSTTIIFELNVDLKELFSSTPF